LIELRKQDVGISYSKMRLNVPHPVLSVADIGAYLIYDVPDACAEAADAVIAELL
jgi:hypothetical protein